MGNIVNCDLYIKNESKIVLSYLACRAIYAQNHYVKHYLKRGNLMEYLYVFVMIFIVVFILNGVLNLILKTGTTMKHWLLISFIISILSTFFALLIS